MSGHWVAPPAEVGVLLCLEVGAQRSHLGRFDAMGTTGVRDDHEVAGNVGGVGIDGCHMAAMRGAGEDRTRQD